MMETRERKPRRRE